LSGEVQIQFELDNADISFDTKAGQAYVVTAIPRSASTWGFSKAALLMRDIPTD
jgi:hypothetical protein